MKRLEESGARDLAAEWAALREKSPSTRIRDAARELGVPEAALVATRLGAGARRLRPQFADVLRRLPTVGRVMALSRNESAVHERKGRYEKVAIEGAMGTVLGPDIDLRLFLARWRHGFAVEEEARGAVRKSLQFFDASGGAIHKVYALEDTDGVAWDALVAEFAADAAEPAPAFTAPAAATRAPEKSDADVDVPRFRREWEALADTHDFFPLLARHGLSRTQALRLAGDELARPVAASSLRATLERAAAGATPIMVFVGNAGILQIHGGPVKNVVATPPWINVLDPDFNLHAREDRIDAAWVVRKPTRDGIVTSLELFDAEGETIALLFGVRKPGIAESPAWREIASGLEREDAEARR